MDEHDKKYYEFIASAISNLVKVADDNTKFDRYYNQLYAVVPKYGLSLTEFASLLDIVIDTRSEFKSAQKNKLLTLFHCRELLDFDSILKIVSVFKVSSYYNKRSTTVVLSKTLQTKLAHFLLKNFVNIRWEKKFLGLLNLLFDLLSIGYLRLNIGLFLIYLLRLSSEIDPLYNKRYFYTAKKFNSLLEFYELDKASTLPLLLSFAEYLSSAERSYTYDSIYSRYLLILSHVKVPKDVFGKRDELQINQLATMKKLANLETFEIDIFRKNVSFYIQLIESLNQCSRFNFTSTSSKKRKYLEDEDLGSTLKNLLLPELYSTQRLSNELVLQSSTYRSTVIFLLKYLSSLDSKSLQMPEFLVNLDPDYHTPLFAFYAPILSILINCDFKSFDKVTKEIIQLKGASLFLTPEMHWIFKSLAKFCELHPNQILLPWLQDVFAGIITIDFPGSPGEMMQILNISEFLQFFEPNYGKYESFLKKVVEVTFKLNNVKFMRGIVLLASSWVEKPSEFNKLLGLAVENFRYFNYPLHNEMLLLISMVKSVPYPSIDITQLVMHSDFMAMSFFSGDLFKIDLLLRCVLMWKKYFADYGLKKIEDSFSKSNYLRLKAFKELHNSYVLDICNFLWRNRAFDTKDVSSGRFFGLPGSFIEKLDGKSMDLAHLPATRYAGPAEMESGKTMEGVSSDIRMFVLQTLRQESYTGVVAFLQSSIRGLNSN